MKERLKAWHGSFTITGYFQETPMSNTLPDNPYTSDQDDREAARMMDNITKTVFAPIYPVMAQQITSMHGITTGICLDLGSGPAALSINLAKVTDLLIHAVDSSPHSHAIACANIREAGLEHRITAVQSDVCTLPFESNFADLIISRGSLFFWEDLTGAFNEIYRVLKPGGKTHIGAGFGNAEIKNRVFRQMAEKSDQWAEKVRQRRSPETTSRILAALDSSDACSYTLTQSEIGFWIHIQKDTLP
jgi:ubiquinone/menaquinone biosynthesis C-methylase UbiE